MFAWYMRRLEVFIGVGRGVQLEILRCILLQANIRHVVCDRWQEVRTSPFDKIIMLCHKLADIWTPHIREPGTGRE